MAHSTHNGIKLRCNEMIHVRQLPLKPDMTYFRGDRTRPVEIVKVDVEQVDEEDEGPDQGKVTSVTNIWTVDATLFDSGAGMDAANVVAHGPGRLETRPDRDQPVERIAIWQDRLIVKNKLGPNNEVLHKVIDLIGKPTLLHRQSSKDVDRLGVVDPGMAQTQTCLATGGGCGVPLPRPSPVTRPRTRTARPR